VPRSILIATGNPGKFREITAVLGGDAGLSSRVQWHSLSDIPNIVAEPHESGNTFLENATLKASYYSRASGMWALADDSGLEVDALGGAPGVNSAYFDPATADAERAVRDAANNARLIAQLRGVPDAKRGARYRCVLVLADGDRILFTTDGALEGRIIDQPRGTGGFGYDPYFVIPELGHTVAEISSERKNAISHRGRALVGMRAKIEVLLKMPQ
jgi:XTP/dITP diphosphohydrolase